MNKENKPLIILTLSLLLLLGLFLGASITLFILFLQNHDDLLAIISYLCLVVFIVILIIEMYLFYVHRHQIFKKKEEIENE